MSRRTRTTLEILEELDTADDLQGNSVDVYLTPPDDGGPDTDGDSGDEDYCDDPNRLSRKQLMAEAEIVLDDGNASIDDEIESLPVAVPTITDNIASDRNDDEAVRPTALLGGRKRKTNAKQSPPTKKKATGGNSNSYPRKWVHGDLLQNCASNRVAPDQLVNSLFDEGSHPVDFFELLMDKSVVTNIVKHSVKYAVSKNKPAFELSAEDVYTFMGILFVSGYVPLPRRRMFWETQDDVHNILVSNAMRRNRFEEIFRYLHVADNDQLPDGDKFGKIRPLLDEVNVNFLKYAPIESEVSIDESMIPYFGRHGCKQFIRGKPIRFGFKGWVLAHRLGYCLQADVYQGRDSQRIPEMGLGESVVLNFATILKKSFTDSSFSFYFDNFFTSAKLITKLGEMGFFGTGTVRDNRTEKCPLVESSEMKKAERGTFDFQTDHVSNVIACKWKDNAVVTVMSNETGVHPLQKSVRYSTKERTRVEVPQPNMFAMYNRYMGGVDQMDNSVAKYRIGIRGKKWYMPIIMWIFDVCMNNAWLLSRACGQKLDNLGFRRAVARCLIMKYGARPSAWGPSRPVSGAFIVPVAVRIHEAAHLITTKQARRRCAVCGSKTTKACLKCNVALHDKCFSDFHQK